MVPRRGAGRTALRGLTATADGSASTRSRHQIDRSRPAAPAFSPIVVRASALGDCVKSHQIIAGMMVAAVSRPAAAVAARPAFVR